MAATASSLPIDAPTRLEIAVAAGTTDRSVKSALRGLPMKPVLLRRIRAELERRGLGHLLPAKGVSVAVTETSASATAEASR